VGYSAIGLERDEVFFAMAKALILPTGGICYLLFFDQTGKSRTDHLRGHVVEEQQKHQLEQDHRIDRLVAIVAVTGGDFGSHKTKIHPLDHPPQRMIGANALFQIDSIAEQVWLGLVSAIITTLALQRTRDAKQVAEWLGHKDGGKLVWDTYSHTLEGREEELAEKLNFEWSRRLALPDQKVA
jgi:hypothetical protein